MSPIRWGGPLLRVVRWRPRRGRKRFLNTLMNSQSKQCPTCAGDGSLYRNAASGWQAVECQECKGTGVAPAEDPTTAGSESIPQVISRRRSLPALAKVKEEIRLMKDEARSAWEKSLFYPANGSDIRAAVVVLALDRVLRMIARLEDEEPEGNTELSSGL
jgi:ribosomal protein L37AE/L43A